MTVPRLAVWGLGTFHASFLVAAAVTYLHFEGAAGGLLSSLDSATGAGLFLILWAITVWTTGQALKGVAWTGDGVSVPASSVVGRAFTWGGATGFLFVLAFAIVLAAREGAAALVFVAAFGSIGGLFVGALIGLLFGGLDVLALLAARALLLGSVDVPAVAATGPEAPR